MKRCSLCNYERKIFPLFLNKGDGKVRCELYICNVCWNEIKLIFDKTNTHFCQNYVDEAVKSVVRVVKEDEKEPSAIVGLEIGIIGKIKIPENMRK